MVGNIDTCFDHHLQRAFDDPLYLPFPLILLKRDRGKLAYLLKICIQLRQFSLHYCHINHVRISIGSNPLLLSENRKIF